MKIEQFKARLQSSGDDKILQLLSKPEDQVPEVARKLIREEAERRGLLTDSEGKKTEAEMVLDPNWTDLSGATQMVDREQYELDYQEETNIDPVSEPVPGWLDASSPTRVDLDPFEMPDKTDQKALGSAPEPAGEFASEEKPLVAGSSRERAPVLVASHKNYPLVVRPSELTWLESLWRDRENRPLLLAFAGGALLLLLRVLFKSDD